MEDRIFVENGHTNTEKKTGIGARIGYFFLSWTPLIASFVLQLGLSFIYMLVKSVGAMVFFLVTHPEASEMEAMIVYERALYESLTGGVILYHVLSIPIFALWYYFGCKRPKMKQSFKNLSVQAIVIAVLGGVVMSLLANGIVGMQQYLMPDVVEAYVESMESIQIDTNIWMILTSILLAPVGEEFLCRGIILYYGEKALPKFWMANVLQALMFGIMHFNWVQGIYAFCIGLFLGHLKKRYRSIIPCMLLHLVVNLLSALGFGMVFAYLPESFFTYLGVTILTVVAAIGMVAYGFRKKSS